MKLGDIKPGRPPGMAELEALVGARLVVEVDDVDRAIKVISSGAPRPPRSRGPGEFEQLVALAIDFFRYQQEVAALAGDELDDDELWRAWLALCNGPVSSELLDSWARRTTRADNVRFLLDHIRQERRGWLANVPRIKRLSNIDDK